MAGAPGATAILGRSASAQDKTDSTTVIASPTTQLFGGEIVWVVGVSDNAGTTTGASTEHTVTDSTGANTWTRLIERCLSPGGVEKDGVVVSVWQSKLARRITVSDTITLTTTAVTSTDAKCMNVMRTRVPFGKTLQVAGSIGIDSAAATQAVSASVSGLTSGTYLYLGATGIENTSVTSDDADYTVIAGTTNTSGSTAATNVAVRCEYRLFTGTGDTFDFSLLGPLDRTTFLIAFEEVADTLPWTPASSTLLGHTSYDPGSTEAKTVTSTSGADYDATNLAVSFTPGDSGDVLLYLGASHECLTSSMTSSWYVHDGSADVFDPVQVCATVHDVRDSLYRVVTGLAGAQTWTWRGKVNNATGASIRGGGGDAGYGAFEMQVYDIPDNALLGETVYAPVTPNTYTIASATLAAIDTTNLTLTFTTPSTGRVRLAFDGFQGGGAAGAVWVPVDSSAVAQTQGRRPGAGENRRIHIEWIITGLPISTSLTWRWGWFRHAGGDDVELLVGEECPAIMQVWAL